MIVESVKEEKMYVKFSNNVEVEQRGSYLDVEGIKMGNGADIWLLPEASRRSKPLMCGREDMCKSIVLIGISESLLGFEARGPKLTGNARINEVREFKRNGKVMVCKCLEFQSVL
ncbi:hypothetical protein Tco_0233688 [Tanacetum coccineum]